MKTRMTFVLVAAILFSANFSFAENWPAWRGADGRAVSHDSNPPVNWSADENVRWKTPLPAAGNSTPIVWEDRVFLTQSLDGGKLRTLVCYDRQTGKKQWQRGVKYPNKETSHGQNPPCSGSPTTDGKLVYASYGSAGVIACDFEPRAVGQQTEAEHVPNVEQQSGSTYVPFEYVDNDQIFARREQDFGIEHGTAAIEYR